MSFAELGVESLDGIAALCARSLVDPPEIRDLHRALFDPARPAIVLGDPEQGVVAAVERRGVGAIRFLAVDPAHTGRRLGHLLVEDAEKRLASVGSISTGGDAPDYLWPGIDCRETATICLFESLGYKRTDMVHNMGVDLQRLPEPVPGAEAPDPSEREEIRAWLEVLWPDWTDEAMRGFDLGSFAVARDTTGIAGIAAWNVNRQGWFGPTAVRPELIGKGLGRPLLLHALHAMRAEGRARADIAWIGPHRFYARAAGAVIDRTYWVMRKDLNA